MNDFEDGISAQYQAVVTPTPIVAKRQYCFPGAIENGQVQGFGVEFYAGELDPWFGTFAAGDISPNAAHIAMHHPNSWNACIVSKGNGYIVNVREPSDWTDVPLQPIMGMLPIAEKGVLICWDFTRFLAIGVDGILWRTPRLSWDGIRGVRIESYHIVADVWDAPRSAWIPTAVQITNGFYTGGSSPELYRCEKPS